VATGCCGLATSFTQLLLVRIGVGAGEAGCIPSAHSLIADYFTRAERPLAVARYMLGVPLGLTVGYLAVGWLNELYGWRATFAIVGLPGLILAAVAGFTLREPRRIKTAMAAVIAAAPQRAPSHSAEPSFKSVCTTLWANSALRHLLFCFSVWYFFGHGLQLWTPTFFIRSHGLQSGELGTWLAIIYGVCGGVGTYFGGDWATRYAAGNERLQLRVCAGAFLLFPMVHAGAFLARNHYLAFVGLALGSLNAMTIGPIFATIQSLVPPRMRAIAIALVYLFANLIGMGLGPLAVGALSDALRPILGEESLRYVMVAFCPGYFWAAWHLWRASQTVARDLRATHLESNTADDAPIKLAVAEQ
jgi:MFS family permease